MSGELTDQAILAARKLWPQFVNRFPDEHALRMMISYFQRQLIKFHTSDHEHRKAKDIQG